MTSSRISVDASTVMLMTVSVVFLLTTCPNVIYFLKIDEWLAESPDAHSKARLNLAFAVTNLLYYTNNASNFFLYCLAGSRFRRAMSQMFRRQSRQESHRHMMGEQERRWTDPLIAGRPTVPYAGVKRNTLATIS